MAVAVKEFADFLGGQPPFDALDADDLARLVARVEVEYFAAGAVVVAEDEGRLTHLWVVRTGALEVLDRGQVVDMLGPGDTFGHLWLLSDLPPRLLVRAHEESLCLRIPDPRTFLAHPERLRFTAVNAVSPRERLTDAGAARGSRRLADLMRPVVWGTESDRVRDIADRISQAGTSCALVRTDAGLGIVTDNDFRRRVATGQVEVDAPVARVATVPALTIDQDATQAAGLLRMVEHGVHHLVVTDQSARPVGVVRVVDLARAEVRDPLLVRSAIEGAATLDELARAARLLPTTIVELSDNEVPAAHIGALHTAVVDAIVRRVLDLHPSPVLAGVRHSWVLLGSLARHEPLPLSDVDTALVWDDPPDAAPDPGAAIRCAAWQVLQDLERCGLTLCANGANAHNPLFSRSRSEWAAAARAWQADPTQDKALLLSTMVADSRPLTDPPLGRALTDQIRSHTRTAPFLRALLDEALGWRPPTGFVRNFVVAHSGEHRGQLELKSGGMVPVVALARWIAIVNGDTSGTTTDRLRRTRAGTGRSRLDPKARPVIRRLPVPHPRTPWREAEFCVVDLETTGLDLRRDEIIAYGAAVVAQARIPYDRTTYGLVRPTRAVSVPALTVHGLRAADLAHAPVIDEVVGDLVGLLSNRVLVAHAAWVDRAFLDRALRPHGRRVGPAVIDTAALLRACRLADANAPSEPNLEAASVALGLPVHTPHHALGDAFTTAQLFLALATRLERVPAGRKPRPLTVRQLCAISKHHRL